MNPELISIQIALAAYWGATILSFIYLAYKDERLSRWMLNLLGIGIAFHLASFGFRIHSFWQIPENRYFLPINTFFGDI